MQRKRSPFSSDQSSNREDASYRRRSRTPHVLTRQIIENSKKLAKKFKKLKNTIMASFEAKIGWKRARKRENKNYRSVLFQLDA